MQFSLSVLCLLTTVCGVAVAWYNKFDNNVYGGWAPNRRSPRMCVSSEGKCLISRQCCDPRAICSRNTNFGFGTCEVAERQVGSYGSVSGGSKVGLKKTDEECVDSFECADQCCRLIKLGRMGPKYTCGKPRRYRCKGRQVAPSDVSNMYGNY